jgi:hypothetical protein
MGVAAVWPKLYMGAGLPPFFHMLSALRAQGIALGVPVAHFRMGFVAEMRGAFWKLRLPRLRGKIHL